MKFGKRIRGEALDLWEDYYVDYKVDSNTPPTCNCHYDTGRH